MKATLLALCAILCLATVAWADEVWSGWASADPSVDYQWKSDRALKLDQGIKGFVHVRFRNNTANTIEFNYRVETPHGAFRGAVIELKPGEVSDAQGTYVLVQMEGMFPTVSECTITRLKVLKN